jgi:hypothetical protein
MGKKQRDGRKLKQIRGFHTESILYRNKKERASEIDVLTNW